MNRRRFLARGGVALAATVPGCVGTLRGEPANRRSGATDDESGDDSDDGDGSTDVENDESDVQDLQSGPFGGATVVEFETVPLRASIPDGHYRTDDGLALTVDLVSPATAEDPATVAAELRNESTLERAVRLERLPGFANPPLGRADDATAYLAPTEGHELAETVPAFARDDGRWRLDQLDTDWFSETLTLEPDDSFEAEYRLLGPYNRNDPPLAAGTYRFRSLRGEEEFQVVLWRADEPGPDTTSAFENLEVPSLTEYGETAWYHDASTETEVSLRPDAESVSAPARVDYELVNHGTEPLSGNPFRWGLYKLDDGEWFKVEPWAVPVPASSLQAGERRETSLRLYHGEPVPCEDARVVGYLGGGRYAYHGGFGDGTTHAAVLDLEAPDLEAEPTNDIEVERDGDRVTVESARLADARTPTTLTVSRVDAAEERLIPEQLPREPNRALRNTVPFFEPDVEQVRLRTDRGTALRVVDYEDGGRRRFEYRGEAFEAVGEEDG